MNRLARTTVIFSIAVLGAIPVARGQQQLFTPATITSDATATTIADLDIPEGMPVAELLEVLKAKAPGFDYVVHHGRWEQLALPRMHLANVTLGSVLDMLGRLFPSSCHYSQLTKSGGKDIYLFSSNGNMEGENAGVYTVVQVFSLSGAIDRQYNLEGVRGVHGPISEARKRCMAAVLSLIENELKQADAKSDRPTLSVHEETETLVVKGTPSRASEMAGVLKALDAPVDQNQLRAYQSSADLYSREYNRVRGELDDTKRTTGKALQLERDRVKSLEAAINRMAKASPEAMKAATQPADGK